MSEEADVDSTPLAACNLDIFKHVSDLNDVKNVVEEEEEEEEELCVTDGKLQSTDMEQLAVSYFELAVSHEKGGRMYQAVQCYKHALQLYPDVESAIRLKCSAEQGEPNVVSSVDSAEATYPSELQLLGRFEERLTRKGVLVICQPDKPIAAATHITSIPPEVFLHIFKYTSLNRLDAYQLEQLSMVCCGFYKLARNQDLWREMCSQIWGDDLGKLQAPFTSWRHMFLDRPHLWFNGLYASRVSYLRMGDVGYEDRFYRPWHQVVYFRCIRFFQDGTVLMVTTADSPKAIIETLMSKCQKSPSVLIGYYKMVDECNVVVNLDRVSQRQKSRQLKVPPPELKYTLQLRLSKVKNKKYNALRWVSYEISCGKMEVSKFALDDQRFPPFFFSRIRQYNV